MNLRNLKYSNSKDFFPGIEAEAIVNEFAVDMPSSQVGIVDFSHNGVVFHTLKGTAI